MKILLIEDMEELRVLLTELLTGLGYEVSALEEYGSDIRGEIRALASENIDIIVSDFNFSAYCHFDFVKALAEEKNLPLVLQTSEIESYWDYQVFKSDLHHQLEPTIIKALEDHAKIA